MNPTISLDPHNNPARWPAISHANYRARRDRKTMLVYVAPPGTRHCMDAGGFVNSIHNVWFVRPEGEDAPKGAQLFEMVHPPGPKEQRESAPALDTNFLENPA